MIIVISGASAYGSEADADAGEEVAIAAKQIERADLVVAEADERHGQDLFGLARRSGLTEDEAQDAVQEALLRLWLQIRSGIDILEPRAWTFRTLYRIAMDQHRIRRRANELAGRLVHGLARTIEPDEVERISVWSLVDTLPVRQRQVVYLRYKADMTFEQAAAVMNITSSAARAHAAFAAVRLRELMGPGWRE